MTPTEGFTFTPESKGGAVTVTSGGKFIGRIRQGHDDKWYRHGDLGVKPYESQAAAAKGLSHPLYTNRVLR